MREFTKGPWKVVFPSMNIVVDTDGGGCVVGSPQRWCAGWPSKIKGVALDVSNDTRKANAHIIAAAPDMYKILGDIQIALLQAEFESMFPDELKEIAAALAKARGELTKFNQEG